MNARGTRGWSMRACAFCLCAGALGSSLACEGKDVQPTAPSVQPSPTTAPTVLRPELSGVVTEDGHPIENAQVEVVWTCDRGCGGIGVTTDTAGRYKIAGLPEGLTVWAVARKDGYLQQCVATTTLIFRQGNTSLDVRLTSIANLSAARPLSGPGSRTVSGAVLEATPTGRQPVEGASVYVYAEDTNTVYGYNSDPVAYTRSDSAGRYLLCGLPKGPISGLFAEKQGYSFSHVFVQPGTDAIVDIEITRR